MLRERDKLVDQSKTSSRLLHLLDKALKLINPYCVSKKHGPRLKYAEGNDMPPHRPPFASDCVFFGPCFLGFRITDGPTDKNTPIILDEK